MDNFQGLTAKYSSISNSFNQQYQMSKCDTVQMSAILFPPLHSQSPFLLCKLSKNALLKNVPERNSYVNISNYKDGECKRVTHIVILVKIIKKKSLLTELYFLSEYTVIEWHSWESNKNFKSCLSEFKLMILIHKFFCSPTVDF